MSTEVIAVLENAGVSFFFGGGVGGCGGYSCSSAVADSVSLCCGACINMYLELVFSIAVAFFESFAVSNVFSLLILQIYLYLFWILPSIT